MPRIQSDLRAVATEAGDIYLLCSDGLNDVLTDAEIGRLLATHGADPTAAARQLVAAANEAGGLDNISVIVARAPTNASGARARRRRSCKASWRTFNISRTHRATGRATEVTWQNSSSN